MESCFRLLAYRGAALVEATVTHLSPLDSLTSLDVIFISLLPCSFPTRMAQLLHLSAGPTQVPSTASAAAGGWGWGRLTEVRLAHCPMGSAAK